MEIGDSSSFLRRTCVGECVDWRPRPKSGPIVAPDFRFVSPASAPTFTPSKEEFEDPILYISTIRPYAEQFGMCKIIPPEDEEFPFVLNKEKFRFQTRIQNLANIDAFAKDKLIFLGRVGKFWEMRGFPLKTPIVEYRQLDLYTLHSLILRDGGYMKVVEEDNWTSVALRMKYSDSLKSGELLEKSYREILLPYLNLMSEAEKGNFAVTVEENSANKQLSAKEETTTLYKSKKIKLSPVEPRASTSRDVGVNDKAEIEELEKMYSNTIPEQEESTSKLKAELLKGPQNNFKKHIPKTFPTKATASGSKPTEPGSDSKPTEPESDSKPSENASGSKPTEPESDSKPSENASGSKTPEHVFKVPYPVSDTRHKKSNELKRLQFHGAGPRIAIFSEPASGKSGKRKRESSHKKECCKCRNSNIDEITLQCAECRDSYHLTCIVPELTEIPRVNWHCSKCILKKLEKYPSKTSKPPFEDGKEYDLHSFERKAGNFKRAFFKGDTNVSPERVEVEFWNILRKDDPVTVEYGADISGENGTGFPTLETLKSIPPRHHEELMRIVKHPWNLNNLPVSNGSVFKYIDEAISGMKVPWMYIGMLFTTFCWHNEDHWSYSINYHHFGETKTWYSVPGDYAQEFENVVKEMAPGLFEVHPDILHQLSTMINPNVLMHKKVPVYRLDQDARNIVITFPRAYHCGFNHGFNVAEAVNFAPPDWIEVGRRCVENYALSKRMCVFSQDELVFKIAARHQAADIRICAAAYHDLYRAVHDEFAFREFFMGEWGADNIECVVDFETLPDDQRQCEFCKTTVFMSGVSCGCDPVKIVCSKHYDKLCNSCKPEDHYLKIKHTSEEIFRLFKEMLKRVSPYEIWVKNVRTVLRSNSPQQERPGGFTGVEYLRNLVKVAEENRYPNTKLLKELIACVVEVEIMNETSERILSRIGRVEGGSRSSEEDDEGRPTFMDLLDFLETINNRDLAYFKDDGILKYVKDVFDWRYKVRTHIASNCSNSKDMEALKKEGVGFSLNLIEIDLLRRYITRLKWREELDHLFEKYKDLTKEMLEEHRDKGLALYFEKDSKISEGIVKIRKLLDQINAWEKEAQTLIAVDKTKPTPEVLKELLDRGDEIRARLPSRKTLETILQTGAKWVEKVIAANGLKNGPYVDVYEDLLAQTHKINLQLYLTDQIVLQLDLVSIWREKVAATFLKSNALTLMEALAPRNEILRPKKKRDNYLSKNIIYGVKLSGDTDPGVVVAAFKRAEKFEFEQMLQLRLENSRKKIDSEAKYCICRNADSGFMVECSLCKEKFHGPCLQMGIESDMAGSELADTKFLCSTCVRTKRPKLDILVELVQSMHMIKVRIPEGEALQRLTERAMNWQDRARKLLSTPEMTMALQKLYVPLPNIPRPTPRLQQPVNYERSASSTVTSGILVQASTSTPSSSFAPMDHVYSTVSRKTIPPKKHMRKSPLIPRVLEEPPRMSESGFKQLKELMIQGDLMEVFVEEATCIWKLLQTFKQLYYSIWDEGYEDYVRHEAEKAKQEAAELKVEKGLSAIERFFQDKPSPPPAKKRAAAVNEVTPTPAKRTVKTPRKTSAKKTPNVATKSTKVKKPEPKQTRKKQKAKRPAVRPAKRAKKSKHVDDDDDENDENSCEDDCAAEPCKRPTGSSLNWVQCDGGCDLWFHLYCIGLNKDQIDDDEDYVCDKCS